MQASLKLLSEITSYSKYQRYIPTLGRRETWPEAIERNARMHRQKYRKLLSANPEFRASFDRAYELVHQHKILPSMRSMQLGGLPIRRQEARIYNCAYLPMKDLLSFSEVLYLLLCGTGVGYSVQFHHVDELPPIYHEPHKERRHTVEDSIEGWARAVDHLVRCFMDPSSLGWPTFDFSQVRPKGAIIRSIWTRAPGPEPLREVLERIRKILSEKPQGSKLTSVEVMDITNMLSEVVLAGGVRRSAMICLFSPQDEEMLQAKSGASQWWKWAPWRARSNNSAVLFRGDPHQAKKDFERIWEIVSASGSGEPGFLWTNEECRNLGTNPCSETSLSPYQFCNLTEINTATITSQADFNERAYYASFLGTLQAGYTNFHHLSSRWRESTERDALLGVGLTGIANGAILGLEESEAARKAVEANKRWSKVLEINPASRVTCTKPSGTTSLVLGCASGIHAIHSPYYIRRIRLNKLEPLYGYLLKAVPELIEDEKGNEALNGVLSVPIHAESPQAVYRNESPIDFLERVGRYQLGWVEPGHLKGPNPHSISATVSIRPSEKSSVKEWLWKNREKYSCISCFPASESESIYAQTPYEECSRSDFLELSKHVRRINLEEIDEKTQINESLGLSPACAGGQCEL